MSYEDPEQIDQLTQYVKGMLRDHERPGLGEDAIRACWLVLDKCDSLEAHATQVPGMGWVTAFVNEFRTLIVNAVMFGKQLPDFDPPKGN
jgi:hypothetical protein